MAQRASSGVRVGIPEKPKLVTITAADEDPPAWEDDVTIRRRGFHRAGLECLRLVAPEIEQCKFDYCRLMGSKFDRCTISDSVFDQSDLSNMSGVKSSFSRVEFATCRLTGFSWVDSTVRDVTFTDCRIDLSCFKMTTFRRVVFRQCNLTGADFQNGDLRRARFESCDLSGAQFSGAQLDGARFGDCALFDIRGVASLRGATIRTEDLLTLAGSLAGSLGIHLESPRS